MSQSSAPAVKSAVLPSNGGDASNVAGPDPSSKRQCRTGAARVPLLAASGPRRKTTKLTEKTATAATGLHQTLSVFFLFWGGVRRRVARVAGGFLPCPRVLAASAATLALADIFGLRRAEETKLSRSWVPLDRWNGQAKLARAWSAKAMETSNGPLLGLGRWSGALTSAGSREIKGRPRSSKDDSLTAQKTRER